MAPIERVNDKLLSWASLLDDKARLQAEQASRLPFIYPHVALMPDAHWGMGATVGSVIPTDRAIIPAAVGVDIGCGMIAVQTQYGVGELSHLDLGVLRGMLERRIGLSAGVYGQMSDRHSRDAIRALEESADADAHFNPDEFSTKANWRLQLGSLGGGNHFIELTVDEADQVWLFLHSGSRGVGNRIASHHIGVARELCKAKRVRLPNPDLAFLVEDDEEFWPYMRQMRWAQGFARLNREVMMGRFADAFDEWHGGAPAIPQRTVNCHHNYTERETHFGREVWLSRKGAINAAEGVWGLIPGSMGTASYVVQGRGDRDSLNSSPHGAGRMFSRSKAKERFTLEDLEDRMKGIEWRHSAAFLDEHPDAYKDIDVVMQDAADLVEVRHTLRQVLNVKGD